MTVSVRSVCAAIGIALACLNANPRAIEPTGFLLGQVVDAITGNPVAGATVALSGGNPNTPRILTNTAGQFLFRPIGAGRYQINATAPGYLPNGSFGQTRAFGPNQTIDVAKDDEKRGDLRVRLWPEATITGTIKDDDGEPIAGCEVQIFRRTVINGTPRFALQAPMEGFSDDRGNYRISGLAPGEYLVGVMSKHVTMPAATVAAYLNVATSPGGASSSELGKELRSSRAPETATLRTRIGDFMFDSSLGRRGDMAPPSSDGKVSVFPSVFYPAAEVAAQASLVTLSPGETRNGIDLQLRLTPTVRVSGTISGPMGPLKNQGVRLLPAGFE